MEEEWGRTLPSTQIPPKALFGTRVLEGIGGDKPGLSSNPPLSPKPRLVLEYWTELSPSNPRNPQAHVLFSQRIIPNPYPAYYPHLQVGEELGVSPNPLRDNLHLSLLIPLCQTRPNWGRIDLETPFPVPILPASSLPPTHERELPSAIPFLGTSSSVSRPTAGPRQKSARVRHSAMYSDRPRRSRPNRGGRAQQPASSRIEDDDDDAGKASSNELGSTISDTSKFETLSLNDSPPALDSTDRAVVHAGDMGTSLPDSTIMAPPAAEEALSCRSEKRSTADLLKDQPMFDSVDDCMDYFCKSERAERAARYKTLSLSRQSSLDKYEAQRALVPPNQAQPVPGQEQASVVAAQGRYEGSKGKIAEDGNKWMSEELRVAFQNYLEKEDDLKECDYEFEKLEHQCFHVENYCKIFHHFNFTVKMKKPGSSEWTSGLYFAEVKEILRKKSYFCCPLDSDENGNCYACKNQQVVGLQHPVIGAFDRGSPDIVFPYMYARDSSDDDDGPFYYECDSSDDDDGPVYDEAWRMRMRAAGIRVG